MSIEDKTILRDLLVTLIGLPNNQVMWRSKSRVGVVTTKAEQGICGNILDLRRNGEEYKGTYRINDILEDLFKKWPKFSGSTDYPIPGDYTAFNACVDLSGEEAIYTFWEGEQGQLRVELCNFMIDELNKELEANG